MKRFRKTNILLAGMLLILITSFTACGGGADTKQTNQNPAPSTVTESSSSKPGDSNSADSQDNSDNSENAVSVTSMQGVQSTPSNNGSSTPSVLKYIALGDELGNKITSDLAISFIQKSRKKILINREGIGPTVKLSNLVNKKADIAFLTRPLNDNEKALKLNEDIFGYDAIAVIVNNNCLVKDLSVDKIKKLLKGEIKNWSDLGGSGGPIRLKMNPTTKGSRTVTILNGLFGLDTKTIKSKNIEFGDGDTEIINDVAQNENMIGIVSFDCIDNASIYPIDINGVEPSMENLLSGKYKLSIPFSVFYADELKPDMKDFVNYLKGPDGQKSIAAKGYYPVKK
ncbi:MAG: substrate-binding domain-containing protein [Bacillota bacterium]|nr:substrate-binding domain-containing protein [Bacillota bacterium]